MVSAIDLESRLDELEEVLRQYNSRIQDNKNTDENIGFASLFYHLGVTRTLEVFGYCVVNADATDDSLMIVEKTQERQGF